MQRADRFREALLRLLPPGKLTRAPGSANWKLLDGLAQEFARVEERGEDLLREVDPRTATETLEDWERVLRLPDPDAPPEERSIGARRAAAGAKLLLKGGQRRAYFIRVAAALGYIITITEFRPFVAGSTAGSALTNGLWLHTWQVNAPSQTDQPFLAGSSVAGDPLSASSNGPLEAVLERLKPSHSFLLFSYS